MTEQRMTFRTAAPQVHRAMLALDAAAKQGLDPVLAELVQIRAAQINRCAYCIGYHTRDARKAGETEQRIFQLTAWEESRLYTERERAALALTDAVTLLPHGVSDQVYAEASRHFEEPELARLIALILTANAWNRINVTCRTAPDDH
ncbi:alkyl hydroperoxide reductase AhpD [Actinoplanes lobatus]|uniref:AhpD family alkylhydroperoxidase n=1 Tax=Actinoplanes lobatus TaxID=113568 RepID=A0A7W7HJB5_9ACTN|nr:carboxymuconolactone decarboxylase family protein [Actinoplanes lobatus]MBB4751587.1 AhpD family alkylhydroperoxidase [Actinoplanes lobatus]GGN64849.1 alkyl hydroperoxide reductase AhpD [Actinoplanes lobatus]GIE43171.1 alkyl hydroperoxide reductase AhpD [Actinoplanes lobatus]